MRQLTAGFAQILENPRITQQIFEGTSKPSIIAHVPSKIIQWFCFVILSTCNAMLPAENTIQDCISNPRKYSKKTLECHGSLSV